MHNEVLILKKNANIDNFCKIGFYLHFIFLFLLRGFMSSIHKYIVNEIKYFEH